MTLAFRNVNASPNDPVRTWPQEALQTALERGDSNHWRRIIVEIRADPWGSFARMLEQVLTYSRPYGTAELMDRALVRARDQEAHSEREEVAARVRKLFESSGLSRAEFAADIGTSQSRLSTYLSGKVTPSAAMMVRMERLLARVTKGDHGHV